AGQDDQGYVHQISSRPSMAALLGVVPASGDVASSLRGASPALARSGSAPKWLCSSAGSVTCLTVTRFPSDLSTVIVLPAETNSPSLTTSIRSPLKRATPAGRRSESATPTVPARPTWSAAVAMVTGPLGAVRSVDSRNADA